MSLTNHSIQLTVLLVVLLITRVASNSQGASNSDNPPETRFEAVRIESSDGPIAAGELDIVAADEAYFTLPIEGKRSVDGLYWLRGGNAVPVRDEGGKRYEGAQLALRTTGVRVYACPLVQRKRHLHVLDKGTIRPLRMPDGNPFVANDLPLFHGAAQEVIQLEGQAEFFRVAGDKATLAKITDPIPEMRHPWLVVEGERLFLLNMHTLHSLASGDGPARLSEILEDGRLVPICFEGGAVAEFGLSNFFSVGGRTFAALRGMSMKEDYLWRLVGRNLVPVLSAEGEHILVPSPHSPTVASDYLYVPSRPDDSGRKNILMVSPEGKATIVKHSRKPLQVRNLSASPAGARALISDWDGDPGKRRNYVVAGDEAFLLTLKGKVLSGFAVPFSFGDQLFLSHEYDRGKFELLVVRDGYDVSPVHGSDGAALIGSQALLHWPFRLYGANNEVYCTQVDDKPRKALLHLVRSD